VRARVGGAAAAAGHHQGGHPEAAPAAAGRRAARIPGARAWPSGPPMGQTAAVWRPAGARWCWRAAAGLARLHATSLHVTILVAWRCGLHHRRTLERMLQRLSSKLPEQSCTVAAPGVRAAGAHPQPWRTAQVARRLSPRRAGPTGSGMLWGLTRARPAGARDLLYRPRPLGAACLQRRGDQAPPAGRRGIDVARTAGRARRVLCRVYHVHAGAGLQGARAPCVVAAWSAGSSHAEAACRADPAGGAFVHC